MKLVHMLIGGGIIGGGLLLAAAAEAQTTRINHVVSLGNRTLRAPVSYTIEERFPGVVLWCAEFQLYGSGAKFLDALTELTSALYTRWSTYTTTSDDQLGPRAVAEKARLRWLMGEA